MKNVAYYNGKMGLQEELTIPFLDRAMFFGDGVYDATYSANRKIFENNGPCVISYFFIVTPSHKKRRD